MKQKSGELTLVTGASGFVGNNLVRRLLDQGGQVRALAHHCAESLEGLDIEIVRGDILDPVFLRNAVQSAGVVYHLAAEVAFQGNHKPEQMRRINVDGTRNVAEACLQNGVRRMVHCSSIHALSHLPLDEPIDESRPLAIGIKHMAYDRSKAEAEQAVMQQVQRGLDAVIIVPTWIFGPNDYRPSASGEFVLQLLNRRLPAIVDGGYFCVDVRDVVEGAVGAEQFGRCGQRYILPGHYATFKQLSTWICGAAGIRPPRFCLPAWVAAWSAPAVEKTCKILKRRPLMTSDSIEIIRHHQKILTTKAADELGFTSRPTQQTIADTIDWHRDNLRI